MTNLNIPERHAAEISKKLSLPPGGIRRTIELLKEGATVPFISRYRKEATGNLDEEQIRRIRECLDSLEALEKRRKTVLETIESQGLLTEEMRERIWKVVNLRELEDLYLPYKPKRRTRAFLAREQGLEPLARLILSQPSLPEGLEKKAAEFRNDFVPKVSDVLQGARDIIAEGMSEDGEIRSGLRGLYSREALITSRIIKKKEEEALKYRDYFNWSEKLKKCPSHRILAVLRGAGEGYLRVHIQVEEEKVLQILRRRFVRERNECAEQVKEAAADACSRLLAPSLETEFLNAAKEAADEEAIKVFAGNLRQLLLAAPLGPKRILAIDPGYRTGCKLVCLDEQGSLLHHDVIFPHEPQKRRDEAAGKLRALAEEYGIEALSIGNGTAGRETEEFVREIDFGSHIPTFMVNEDGASVYSASREARKEMPDQDVTVRGAVSIGRRLMDPLSELVKIDPKSIGVGQYQHDVDQKKLRRSLDTVVESCVNLVGVNVNTAGPALLRYVSGMGTQLAERMVRFREEKGPFGSRKEFMQVSGMGPKAFEQSAGFLRIPEAENPLDRSAVHPESYGIVRQMASDQQCRVEDLMTSGERRSSIVLEKYIGDTAGLPTLRDILKELAKPGRDPRPQLEEFRFSDQVKTMDDLKPGMLLPGIVTNITRFGAFVDIGIKQDGLVHISELTDRFVRDPAEVVKVQEKVRVRVLQVDRERMRIGLSMKQI